MPVLFESVDGPGACDKEPPVARPPAGCEDRIMAPLPAPAPLSQSNVGLDLSFATWERLQLHR